jgi:hypothetical protein
MVAAVIGGGLLPHKKQNCMANKLQFKPPHGRLIVNGIGEITNDNITQELYERLLDISPAHEAMFHLVDVPEPKAKESKSKPTKTDGNDI